MAQSRDGSSKVFFGGLDEIRAVAALFVVLHHVELYKHREGISSLYDTVLFSFIDQLGERGVHIFFVLSGFLITYLLLVELTKCGSISLRKFYIRRMLRIWPLYYFVAGLSFFVVPTLARNLSFLQSETYYIEQIGRFTESFWILLLLYLVMLPNFALKLFPPVVGTSQAWSIGVEEQFYLIWPQLISRISQRHLPWFLLFVFLCYPFAGEFAEVIAPSSASLVRFFVSTVPLNLMACGGLGATVLFYYPQMIDRIVTTSGGFLTVTFSLLTLLFVEASELLFAAIVMLEILFITDDRQRINLRNPLLKSIGKISYGIYMYHPLVIFFTFGTLHSIYGKGNPPPIYHVLGYAAVLLISIGLSTLSYRHFEKPFIDLKNRRFTVIASGSDAVDSDQTQQVSVNDVTSEYQSD